VQVYGGKVKGAASVHGCKGSELCGVKHQFG
jgi:hypothetical protein